MTFAGSVLCQPKGAACASAFSGLVSINSSIASRRFHASASPRATLADGLLERNCSAQLEKAASATRESSALTDAVAESGLRLVNDGCAGFARSAGLLACEFTAFCATTDEGGVVLKCKRNKTNNVKAAPIIAQTAKRFT